jgi:hypothetical protein
MKNILMIMIMFGLVWASLHFMAKGINAGSVEINKGIGKAIQEQAGRDDFRTIKVETIASGSVDQMGVSLFSVFVETKEGMFFTFNDAAEKILKTRPLDPEFDNLYVVHSIKLPESSLFDGARENVAAICTMKEKSLECYRARLVENAVITNRQAWSN